MLRGFRRTLLRPDTGDGGGDATTTSSATDADNDATTDQSTDTTSTDTTTTDGDTDDDPDTDNESDTDKTDVDDLRRQLRKVNNEAKQHRLAAKDAAERADKAEKERDEALGRAEQAEMAALRMTAARAAGLPDDLASRLAGDNAEELKADAERLAGLIRPAGTTNPLHAGTGTTGDDAGDLTPRDRLNRGYATSKT